MARLFGTDGVRGIAGRELSCDMAYELGRAGATVLTRGMGRPRILIGRDTRISGHMLENALIAGICSVGGDAYRVGVIPTPGIAYLTRRYCCDAGVVISASHNPYEFNGIKFFNRDGFKLPDHVEDEIEALMGRPDRVACCCGSAVGMVHDMTSARQDYIEFLRTTVDPAVALTGLTVVLDCANGAASVIAPELYDQLGANVMSIFDHPNGLNINEGCGSTHMDTLARIVEALGADIGLAFDGDADRLLAVDHQGRMVDGDQIMMILADRLKAEGRLKQDTLVATVMSNLGLHQAARRAGITVETTQVGDRYVLETMLKKGYSLGGEQSGHIIFLEENTTGDGLLTSLHLLQAMAGSQKTLAQLAQVMTPLPQVLVNVPVTPQRRDTWQQDSRVTERIQALEQAYGDSGRVLVRPSGTEPLIRVMLEGEDQERICADAEALAACIRNEAEASVR